MGSIPIHPRHVFGKLTAKIDGRWEVRTLGTSLDLAYLASGRVGGVWHFSQIPPLHFAAGTLLATEAGAIVTDDTGARWTIDSTSLVAAATDELHASLLKLVPITRRDSQTPGG